MVFSHYRNPFHQKHQQNPNLLPTRTCVAASSLKFRGAKARGCRLQDGLAHAAPLPECDAATEGF